MKFILSLLLLIPTLSFAAHSALAGKTFIFQYSDGQHYLVNFYETTLRWEGIQGDDYGKSENDEYRIRDVAPGIFLVNWTEKSEAYVDVVLNLNTMKVFSSGVQGKLGWFREGSILNFQPATKIKEL